MDRGLDPRTLLEDADTRLDANAFVVDARSARLRRISWWSRVIAVSAISVGLVVSLAQWSDEVVDLHRLLPIYLVASTAVVVSSVAQGLLARNRGPATRSSGHIVAAGMQVVVAMFLTALLVSQG